MSSPTYALSSQVLVGNSSSFVASSSEFVSFSKAVTIPDIYHLMLCHCSLMLALSVVEKRRLCNGIPTLLIQATH